MSKDKDITRRAFLGAGAGTAALLGGVRAPAAGATAPNPGAPPPDPAQLEREAIAPPPEAAGTVARPGSDLMVEVLRDLGVEYVVSNPGSSFEGLQESIINHGDPPNVMPEFVTALHEETAVDMAHGYAKAEGRPIVALVHGTLGLMHGSMAIYQAYHTQTPVVLIAGRDDTNFMRAQTANDLAGIVRSYTKWDAHPRSLPAALEALQEAYRQSITPPCGPALVVLDTELQKMEAGDLAVPAYVPPAIKGIAVDQVRKIAEALVAARNPRIAVGRLRTPAGVRRAVELAELVGASVETSAVLFPMSFPQGHRLCGPGADTDYDVILGLEAAGRDYSIRGPHRRMLTGRDAGGIGYGFVREPPTPVWGFYAPPEPGRNDVTADAEASLPFVIEAVRRLQTVETRARALDRSDRHATANRAAREGALRRALEARRRGWDGSPVSLARLYAELWSVIRDEDWCLASPTQFSGGHNRALWEHDRPYSHLGMHGAGGLGYCIGASTGAALAARSRGRIVINIQPDGDLNYVPGALWTAAHYRLPMLVLMHNNRAYHQEFMYAQHVAGTRGRGADRAHIGMTFRDPIISYAKLAEGYGVESEGPIDDPADLLPALERGVAAVKAGRPYLVDILTQPR